MELTNYTLHSFKPTPSSSIKPSLVEESSDFYLWLLESASAANGYSKAFKHLGTLQRMAQMSQAGGNFLLPSDEQRAVTTLKALREDLYSGQTRQHEIASRIKGIIDRIAEDNCKARLIVHTIEIESLLRELPSSVEEVHPLLLQIIQRVTPALRSMEARAAAQDLAKMIENPWQIDAAKIQRTIRDWL